jgi:hypothetical protein
MKLLFENWRKYLYEGFKDIAADRGTYLSAPSDLRYGKGLGVNTDAKKSIFPGWEEIKKAMLALHSELEALSKEESKIADISWRLVNSWIKTNKKQWLETETLALYRATEDELRSVYNLAHHLTKMLPKDDSRFFHSIDLVEYLGNVSGARAESMGLGYDVDSIDPENIPKYPGEM